MKLNTSGEYMRKKKENKDVLDLMMMNKFDSCVSESALNRLNDGNCFMMDNNGTERDSSDRKRTLKELMYY